MVRDVIRAQRDRGATVFLNSHLLSEIELVCDRVAIVDHGRVVQEGGLQDMLARGHELEVRAGGLTAPVVAALEQRWQVRTASREELVLVVSRPEDAAEVTRVLVAHGADVFELRPRRTNLEDVFLEWVDGGEANGGLGVHQADVARSVA